MTPDELAEIRKRADKAVVGGWMDVTLAARYVPALLAEVERLTRELDNAKARISYMCTEIGKVADFETARPTKAIDAVRTLAQMANEGYGWKAERDAALAAIERVRREHVRGAGDHASFCDSCDRTWPCPTIRALDAADGAHQQQTGGEG